MEFITYIIGFGITLCTLRAFYNTYLVLSGKSIQKYRDYGEYKIPKTPNIPTNHDPDVPEIEKYT